MAIASALAPAASSSSSTAAVAATETITPASAVRLRASAAVVDGTGAMVTLLYNSVVLGTVEIRSSDPTDHVFNIPGKVDGGMLDIVLANSVDSTGKALRHLKIESLTIGDVAFRPSDSRFSFDAGDGSLAFDGQDLEAGQSTLVRNGALRLVVPTALELFAIAAPSSAAPGFYVDADTGNDADAGTIEKPWKTLAKLGSVRLLAGQGVYLRCGRTWRENLSLNATQLVAGSIVAGYGTDCAYRKAVISGADDFSGQWQKNGNVWSRSLPPGTPKITQLFANGQALRTAQWPDTGSASRDSAAAGGTASSSTRVTLAGTDASSLSGKDLVGATVQVRSQPWFVETRRVTAGGSGRLEMDRALEWSLDSGEAFILQDKLWMLDSPGEFFHDAIGQRLYMIAPATGVPGDLNTVRVEGSVRDVALALGQSSRLVLRDVSLQAAREDGLRLSDAPQSNVMRIEAINNARDGVYAEQLQPLSAQIAGPTISHSLIAGNGQHGVNTVNAERTVINNNRVWATGTAAHHQGAVFAAINAGPGARIEDNSVDGSGYLGIGFAGRGGSVIARNTIAGHCRRLSDCGAIYTWTGRALAGAQQSSTVEDNRVSGGEALLEGAVSAGREIVAGIYIDDFTRNVTVRGNTLAGTPIGIFLHNASDIQVENNRIWLPTLVAIGAVMDATDADWMRGNLFRNNELAPLVRARSVAGAPVKFDTSQAVWFWHLLKGDAALGAGGNLFTGNTTVQLQGPLADHAWLRGPSGERFVDAMEWSALNGGEERVVRPARFTPLTMTLGAELVVGGDFDSGLGAWLTYHDPTGSGFAVQALTALSGCSAGCVSLRSGHIGDLLGSPTFNLRTGAQYVYRWRATTPATAVAVVGRSYISRSVSPWDAMNDAGGFVSYGPRRAAAGETLAYEAFFVAKGADDARINLQLESVGVPVAFDAVSLREVTSYTAARPAEWSSMALAPKDAARNFGCEELGWPPGCTAVAADGQTVTLPFTLAAGASRLLVRGDSPLRR